MKEYWEIIQSFVSWSVYQIPVNRCSTEESARDLVDNGDAYDYITDSGTDNYQIDGVELKES